LSDAETSFLAAIALAERRGDAREEAIARSNYARVLARTGRILEAAELHRAAAAALERCGSLSGAARAYANLGTSLRRAGDFEGAVASAARALAIQRRLGDDAGMARTDANLAIVACELGLPGTALRHLHAAARAAALAGPGVEDELRRSPLFIECSALTALALGDVAAARRWWLDPGRDHGAPPTAQELLLVTRLHAHGDVTEAELDARWRARRLEDGDAAALFDLAEMRKTLLELGSWARSELERLAAAGSERAAFVLAILDLGDGNPSAPRRAAARDRLATLAPGFPEREVRRHALVALLRCGLEKDAEATVQGALRRMLDEVFFDLEPEDRARYRRRDDVKEAMEMSSRRSMAGLRSERAMEVLREVFRWNRELLDEENLEVLLRKIVDAAMTLTGAERGVLFLRRGGRLEAAAARSHGEDIADPFASVSRTVLERTMEEGKPTISTDAREDLSLKSIASVEDLGLRSVLCVPLHGRRQMSGALYLDNPFERAVFETEDLEITESFCAQALLALRSAERRRQVAELLRQVRAANRKLDGELRLSRREAERGARASGTSFAGMVGDSAALRKVFQLIDAVGPTDIPVLITGESGTGKELAARAIYRQSLRAQRPFVAENCAAVPAALLESALFGHVRGAFTGADSDRAGLFELADGGTLFLDEVAEMPVELQTRLLRVLQEKEVRPVGSKKTVRVDVRIIAATNRDPRKAIEEGRLREDLFYRLEGAIIRLPALRERPGDIPLLVEHFLRESAGGKLAKRVSPEALERLASYSWPGNVRELQNEVRRIALLSPGEVVRMDALSPQIREEASRPKKENESARIRPLAEVEREAILEALAATGGHRGKAAAALGVSRSTLYLKLRSITGAGA